MPNTDMNTGAETENLQGASQEPAQETAQESTTQAETTTQKPQETILGNKETTSYDFSSLVKDSGDTFDQEAADAFASVCQETGLSQDQAAGIAKYGIGLLKNSLAAAREQVHAELVQEVKDWGDQTAKELGASYDETVGKAAKTMNYIERQAPGFVDMLGVTGAGSHPAMIKALAALSSLLGEDGGKSGNGSGTGNETYNNTDFSKYR